ncbi:MAG: nitrilase-related carbon-nitrogen hydrolase [Nitrososphaeria archaeon]
MQKLKIALVQLTSNQNKEENLLKVKKFIDLASKNYAKLIVFPEFTDFFATQDISKNDLYEVSEDENSKFLSEVKSMAASSNIEVLIGVYSRGSLKPAVHSTAYLITPEGKILAKYSKSHLFEAFGSSERENLVPSDDMPLIFDYMGFRFGIIVCYEIRFPELARRVTLLGADALLIPSGWYKGYNKEDQWETLVKARAMENTIYVLTSNQIGNSFTGITMAADPAGMIISRATEEEGLIFVELSKERLLRVRDYLPLLKQRRPELY